MPQPPHVSCISLSLGVFTQITAKRCHYADCPLDVSSRNDKFNVSMIWSFRWLAKHHTANGWGLSPDCNPVTFPWARKISAAESQQERNHPSAHPNLCIGNSCWLFLQNTPQIWPLPITFLPWSKLPSSLACSPVLAFVLQQSRFYAALGQCWKIAIRSHHSHLQRLPIFVMSFSVLLLLCLLSLPPPLKGCL